MIAKPVLCRSLYEMKHFPFFPTPISRLPYYSRKWEVDLYAKRDDLFQSALGGSKARMLQYILYPLVQSGIRTIVTAGGPCSNFNRAMALLCAEYGLNLRLISYTDNEDEYNCSLNNFLVKLTDCEFVYCAKKDVPQTIQKVMSESDNLTSFVYGGGKTLAGIYAYYDAVKELRQQVNEIDALFIACGTGTTLTGVCAGMQRFFPQAEVHAISVARSYADEHSVLADNMETLNRHMGTDYDFSNLRFHDEFISGGYGKASTGELATIRECMTREGLVVDPTYTGKAFYGMASILSTERANGNKKILFWHTGGTINLLSQRDLFDESYTSVTK